MLHEGPEQRPSPECRARLLPTASVMGCPQHRRGNRGSEKRGDPSGCIQLGSMCTWSVDSRVQAECGHVTHSPLFPQLQNGGDEHAHLTESLHIELVSMCKARAECREGCEQFWPSVPTYTSPSPKFTVFVFSTRNAS